MAGESYYAVGEIEILKAQYNMAGENYKADESEIERARQRKRHQVGKVIWTNKRRIKGEGKTEWSFSFIQR